MSKTVTIEFNSGERVQLNETGRKTHGGRSLEGVVEYVKIREGTTLYGVLHSVGDDSTMSFKMTELPAFFIERV